VAVVAITIAEIGLAQEQAIRIDEEGDHTSYSCCSIVSERDTWRTARIKIYEFTAREKDSRYQVDVRLRGES
jgi:hypothetical protein